MWIVELYHPCITQAGGVECLIPIFCRWASTYLRGISLMFIHCRWLWGICKGYVWCRSFVLSMRFDVSARGNWNKIHRKSHLKIEIMADMCVWVDWSVSAICRTWNIIHQSKNILDESLFHRIWPDSSAMIMESGDIFGPNLSKFLDQMLRNWSKMLLKNRHHGWYISHMAHDLWSLVEFGSNPPAVISGFIDEITENCKHGWHTCKHGCDTSHLTHDMIQKEALEEREEIVGGEENHHLKRGIGRTSAREGDHHRKRRYWSRVSARRQKDNPQEYSACRQMDDPPETSACRHRDDPQESCGCLGTFTWRNAQAGA